MNLVVYIDVYFFINLVMDGIVLYIVAKLTKQTVFVLRIIAGATVGALGASIVLVTTHISYMLRFILIYVVICGVMVFAAFTYQGIGKLLQSIIYTYVIAIFLGGTFTFLVNSTLVGKLPLFLPEKGLNIEGFIAITGVICISIPIFLRFMNGLKDRMHTVYEVTLFLEGKKVTVNGLFDTGNHLREPLTKKPVIIVEKQVMERIMDKKLLDYTTRVKIIPYRSIGQPNGSLMGLTIDQIEIKVENQLKQQKDVIVGIYEGSLSSKQEYQIILHGELL